MKPKIIVTTILLLFVAASVAYLVVKEIRGTPAVTREEERPAPDIKPAEQKVVVYYFHGNFRCATCRTIEAYAKESVETGFPEALKDGRLQWRVVNIEEPSNEYYVQDFQLTTRSVVLERIAGGERQDWKNLERVWELVRGNKEAFLKYIQDETRTFLEAVSK